MKSERIICGRDRKGGSIYKNYFSFLSYVFGKEEEKNENREYVI